MGFFSSSSRKRRAHRPSKSTEKKRIRFVFVPSSRNPFKKFMSTRFWRKKWKKAIQWIRENRFKTFLIVLGIALGLVAVIAVSIIDVANIRSAIESACGWLFASQTGLITLASIAAIALGSSALIVSYLYSDETSLFIPVMLGLIAGSVLLFGGVTSLVTLSVLGVAKYSALVAAGAKAIVKVFPDVVHWFTHTTAGAITGIALLGSLALTALLTMIGLWWYGRKNAKKRASIGKRHKVVNKSAKLSHQKDNVSTLSRGDTQANVMKTKNLPHSIAKVSCETRNEVTSTLCTSQQAIWSDLQERAKEEDEQVKCRLDQINKVNLEIKETDIVKQIDDGEKAEKSKEADGKVSATAPVSLTDNKQEKKKKQRIGRRLSGFFLEKLKSHGKKDRRAKQEEKQQQKDLAKHKPCQSTTSRSPQTDRTIDKDLFYQKNPAGLVTSAVGQPPNPGSYHDSKHTPYHGIPFSAQIPAS